MSTDGGAGDSGTRRQQPPQGQDGNNPDLYQWSGRDGQPRRRQGQPGPGSQDGAADGSISHEDARDQAAHWHPDMSDPHAQEWIQQSKIQRQKPLQLDQNGDYIVQFGDDLSTIAARELRNQGQAVTRDSIKAEQAAIIAHNDQNFPSLDTNADLVKVGWKLHLEDRQRATGYDPTGDNTDNRGDNRGDNQSDRDDQHRAVPRRPGTGNFTPHGYQNKPSVYVNNFYGDNNTVYEGTNGPSNGDQQAIPRNHRCYGNHGGRGQGGGDLYSYDGSGNGNGRNQRNGQGGDLYSYDGSGSSDGSYNPRNNPNYQRNPGRQQNGNDGDLYSYDGGGSGGRRQPIAPGGSEDLYSYDGGGSGGRRQPNQGGGDLYSYDGGGSSTYNDGSGNSFSRDGNGRYHLQQQQRRPFSNGWGNDGTSYYPGFNDGGQRQPTTVIINNFYGNNNTVYEGSPQNRIQRHHQCSQDGSDNYYNNGGGQQQSNRYRIQPIPNAVPGDSQAQPIPNYRQGDAQYQLIDNQQQNQPRRITQNQNPDVPQYNNQKSQLDDSAADV